MHRQPHDPVAVAILAKAPLPGFAKTRLIPELGAHGAAALQDRFIARAAETACAAETGPVTLWATPDIRHAAFRDLAARHGLRLATQPDGDLGARMLAALAAADGPALVIGTDCPALTADHLRDAAAVLRAGTAEVVLIPAQDGGYVLIGARRPQPALFSDMAWSTHVVMSETRSRLLRAGIPWTELAPLWDVDTPADLERLRQDDGFTEFF
jgi:uncharacterized protein